jgi:hypothetical protein
MKFVNIICICLLLVACTATKKNTNSIAAIDLFKTIITGNFSNSRQVADEIANGKQLHPLAIHVNRVANDKIDGLPANDTPGTFWIIEESYYSYPGKPIETKPFLFQFSPGESNTVLLKVFQFPPGIKKEDIKNDNAALRLNFADLKPSPTFSGAVYKYDKKSNTFSTIARSNLGNDMYFTLTETLGTKQLIVMELLEKDGKPLTSYTTPIVYDRE